MAVAKREAKKGRSPGKQRKNIRTRVRNSGETKTPPSWLALICIGQAQRGEDRHTKRGSQDRLGPLL